MVISLKFVPKHIPCKSESIAELQEFINRSRNLFVLTGAGISTESGIPDYRSEGVGLYAMSDRRPVLIQDFIKSPKIRQRYWARNYVGWRRFSSFLPNESHKTLVEWGKKGLMRVLVTQNVDRLHHKAGSLCVEELHGTSFEVECMECKIRVDRYSFQKTLFLLNRDLHINYKEIRPDGDVELSQEQVANFKIPPCQLCGGVMKPYIVFFGDNVPGERVERIKNKLYLCDALIAIGTSLYVYSSYRFILQAVEMKIPIGIVNIGETRGDKYCSLKLSGRCGEILPQIKANER